VHLKYGLLGKVAFGNSGFIKDGQETGPTTSKYSNCDYSHEIQRESQNNKLKKLRIKNSLYCFTQILCFSHAQFSKSTIITGNAGIF